ncbi:NfeD family protein [Aerococcaceae bacterium NML180378]|nr:NfeD family protein [Aerococcaceae bacterium NML180378]
MVILLLLGVVLLITGLFSKYQIIYAAGALVAFGVYFALPDFNYMLYLLFILGVILLLLELYIPSVGTIGTLGLLLATIALYMKNGDILDVLLTLVYIVLVSGTLIVFFAKSGKTLKIGPDFVLEVTLNKEKGFSAHSDLSELVQMSGVARTDLRPVGRAEFGQKIYDVISTDDLITSGCSVIVERVEGSTIYVKKGV